MDASRFDVQRLDHLGLVAGFCNAVGVEEEIDAKLPKFSHKSNISNGKLLIAMLVWMRSTLFFASSIFLNKNPGIASILTKVFAMFNIARCNPATIDENHIKLDQMPWNSQCFVISLPFAIDITSIICWRKVYSSLHSCVPPCASKLFH